MLRFAEELLLLLLDEQSGDLITLPAQTLDLALAGAVLMDLQRGIAHRHGFGRAISGRRHAA